MLNPRTHRPAPSRAVAVTVAAALLAGCAASATSTGISHSSTVGAGAGGDPAAAVAWVELTAGHVVHAEPLSHPAASRLLAYTALALHEAVASADPATASLADMLSGDLSVPAADDDVDVAATASAAARAVLLGALGEPTPATRAMIDDLAAGQRGDRAADGVRDDVLEASVERGGQVAAAVLRRAAADGYGTRNDRPYTPPTGTGVWELASPATAPVEPFWGTLRPHVLDDARQFPAPTPPAYSPQPDSALGVQARVVHDTSRTLTDEQRNIARFWAPGPAARWMTIAADQVTERKLDLGEATRVLALTAVSVADAAIAAWSAKYELNLIRPVSYIQRHIDQGWQPLLPTPGHPEWPAGHSAGASAAATVLTAVLGDGPVTARDASGAEPERRHPSFAQAAAESASSRIYAGVHYPAGLDAGAEQGRRIGQLVLERAG